MEAADNGESSHTRGDSPHKRFFTGIAVALDAYILAGGAALLLFITWGFAYMVGRQTSK